MPTTGVPLLGSGIVPGLIAEVVDNGTNSERMNIWVNGYHVELTKAQASTVITDLTTLQATMT